MSLIFLLVFILMMGKFHQATAQYIMMDATKEPDEKYKLLRVSYTLYITTIVATYCYIGSLAYVY